MHQHHSYGTINEPSQEYMSVIIDGAAARCSVPSERRVLLAQAAWAPGRTSPPRADPHN